MANAEAQFFRIAGLKLSTPHALFSYGYSNLRIFCTSKTNTIFKTAKVNQSMKILFIFNIDRNALNLYSKM